MSIYENIKIDLQEVISFDAWFLANKSEIETMAEEACKIIPSEPTDMQETDRVLTAYYSRTQFLTARAEHFYKNKLADETMALLLSGKDYTAKQVSIIVEKACSNESRILSILERLEKSISSCLRTLKTEISFEKEKAFQTRSSHGG